VRLRKGTKVDLIGAVGLFAGCSKAELGRIAEAADELSLPAGAVLMREGERGREFVVIVDGEVVVTRGGRRLRTMGPGDFAGEIVVFRQPDSTESSATDFTDPGVTGLRLVLFGLDQRLDQHRPARRPRTERSLVPGPK